MRERNSQKSEKTQDNSLRSQFQEHFSVRGERLVVMDSAYFESKEHTALCLRLLPEYAAFLAASGRETETFKLKCLAYDMADFWRDEEDASHGVESPEAFLIRFEKAVTQAKDTGQYRILSDSEREAVCTGIQAHLAKMLDDPAGMLLHMHMQYTELIEKVESVRYPEERREEKRPMDCIKAKAAKTGKKKSHPER